MRKHSRSTRFFVCARSLPSSPTSVQSVLYRQLLSASSLKREVLRGVDLLVVRELTGGLYYGKPSEIRQRRRGRTCG